MRLRWQLILGFFIWFIPEFFRVYLILPLPGSQNHDTVALAYFLDHFIVVSRIAGWSWFLYSAARIVIRKKIFFRITAIVFVLVSCMLFYSLTQVLPPDKFFQLIKHKQLAPVETNTVDRYKLVIGISVNNESRAYPLQLLAYHHQVTDTVVGKPVVITYCSACRSGRVFSPVVDGKPLSFCTIGMNQYNAIFEDNVTHSWWRQETGECIAGVMKGKSLEEIYSQQLSLASWIGLHPQTLILQADSSFTKAYKAYRNYDDGSMKGEIEKRDVSSWQSSSWVIVVKTGNGEKVFDWNLLQTKKVINDSIRETPVVLMVLPDSVSFLAWNRNIDHHVLQFIWNDSLQTLQDLETRSLWNMKGKCIDGEMKGDSLKPLQAYQEFYHSWNTFHPGSPQSR